MFKLSAKAVLLTLGVIIAVVLIGLGILYGTGHLKMGTADFRGGVEATEKIHADGDYRIAKYNWFFDQCAAVQTSESQLEAAKAELDAGPSDYRRQQINANITAITATRAELINEYNAEATKADTAANFQASELPYKLSIHNEETTCAA